MSFDLNENIYQNLFSKLQNYVVIGAFDGISHDVFFEKINTYNKNISNTIIFVEPVGTSFSKLMNNVSEIKNAKIYCEQAAIGDSSGEITVASVKTEKLSSYPWYIDGCSCVIENDIPLNIYIKNTVNKEDLNFETVACMTFDELIDKYNMSNVEYLQIDTEGYDEKILNSIDFTKYNIKFLKFEVYYLSKEWLQSFIKKMHDYGYSTQKDEQDCYMIKNDFLTTLI